MTDGTGDVRRQPGDGLGDRSHSIRRTGVVLVAVIAAMLGVVASTAAGVRELRGSPYRIGSGFLVFSPNGRWLVTLDSFAGPDPRPLWVMAVNSKTGALRRVRGAPFALGSIPLSAAFSPDGHLLAVNTFSGQIVVFSVNRRTGTLHRESRWSDPHGRADSIAFSPRGGLLAAQDEGSKTVEAGVTLLTVNRRTGRLRSASRWVAPKDMTPAGAGLAEPGGMSFSARGNLLALMISGRNRDSSFTDGVAIFAVKRRPRMLAPMAHTYIPNSDIAGNLAFSPDGKLIAIGNSGDESVPVLRVDQTTGRVQRVPGSPFASGPTPTSLAFSPDGGLLAVVNADGQDFSLFSVSKATGSLRCVPGSPFGQTVGSVGGNWVAFSPRGNLLAFGAGLPHGHHAGAIFERVTIFSTVSCADPDHDHDCDSP